MALFVVILHSPDETAWDNIRKRWPDRSIIVDDRLALVKSGDTDLTRDIASDVGIGADDDISGVVVQMDYYSGNGPSFLAEWIGKNA